MDFIPIKYRNIVYNNHDIYQKFCQYKALFKCKDLFYNLLIQKKYF